MARPKTITETNIFEKCLELGFELYSVKEFKGSLSTLNIKCECGNEYETKFSYLKYRRDNKCKECQDKILTVFNISEYDACGYDVLSDYVNNKTPLYLKHRETGIKFYYSPADFGAVKNKKDIWKTNKKGYIEKIIYNVPNISNEIGDVKFSCSSCKGLIERNYHKSISLSKNKEYNILLCADCNLASTYRKQDLIYIKENNIEIVGEYINQKTPISILCEDCKVPLERTLFYIKQGGSKKCKSCNNTGTSQGEEELQDFVKSIVIDSIDNYRIKNVELDIYIPSFNLGIEYNGYYWHSENNKPKDYHINKTLFFQEEGIKVLHFYDTEWIDKPDIVKNIISTNLGLNSKIFARKCKIKEISSKEKDDFLDRTHLQGKDKSLVKLGLFHNEKLVSVMTFCKSRYDSSYEWELSRFSSESGISVVGGASKLFKHFISGYSPSSVVTYANRRISNGNLYNQMGFTYVGETPLGYNYFKNNKMYSRFSLQKHKLKNKLLKYDPSLSTAENIKNNNYIKCWDCGNLKFEFTP